MAPPNLHHIVLNNGAHDSVGGQPTAASNENFSIPGIAKAVGYKQVAFLLFAPFYSILMYTTFGTSE